MANGEIIMARIYKIGMGDSSAVPVPIYAEVYWVLGVAVPTKRREGLLQVLIDPTLVNANQIQGAVKDAVAAHVTSVTGASYASNEVEGCAL
jgi:hypothetical protein